MPEAGPSTLPQPYSSPEQLRKTKRSRPGKREKQVLRNQLEHHAPPPSLSLRHDGLPDTEAWSWFPLADRAATACPVLFNADCSYCFVAMGSVVRIYAVATAQLLSTLSLSASAASHPEGSLRRATVSCLLLNPANPLQLVVGALDGFLRLWDYREGKLLRTLDLGAPIQHATAHPSLPGQIFVALIALAPEASTKVENEKREELKAGVYSISLKPKALAEGVTASPTTPRSPARRMRLAQPRVVRQLAVSPTGAFLVSLNPTTINICRTATLQRGFTVRLESHDVLTCLAYHPTENYLATGNTKGQIRMWYGVLNEDEDDTGAVSQKKEDAPTSVLHWHAHPVASLAFTPNGAYLMSGGEEAVLVLWQLHTGHREFVPRVGAPIVTLSITNGVHTEQQVVARLQDGTVIFIGSQKLKIVHTISGLKSDSARLSDVTNQKRPSHVPLAIQPLTKSLVISAGHPSSLQFYSPVDDAQLLELEISPSNRVTAAGAPLEPTRVERVAFSTPAGSGKDIGSYWMATLDTWENGAYTAERHLKFWKHSSDSNSFALTTRVDLPHADYLTSLSFSPSPSSPLLLTTSHDGSIKLWAHHASSWACRTSLSYRSFVPIDAAWAVDGSMFAVAHARSVSLWSTAEGKILHSFACAGIAPVLRVAFVGAEGTTLLAGGKHGTLSWDLLTFEETSALTLDVETLTCQPGSSTFLATEKSSGGSTGTFLVSLSESSSPSLRVTHRPLPFAVRQALFLDGILPGASNSDVAFAAVNDEGAVLLVGGALATALSGPKGASALPEVGKGQSRLFEEIFGAGSTSSFSATGVDREIIAHQRDGGRKALEVLDAPAHTLPPARLLWRSMMTGFKVAPTPSLAVNQPAVDMEGTIKEPPIDEDQGGARYSAVESLAEQLRARLSMEPRTVAVVPVKGKAGQAAN